jgi:hypothetical protein
MTSQEMQPLLLEQLADRLDFKCQKTKSLDCGNDVAPPKTTPRQLGNNFSVFSLSAANWERRIKRESKAAMCEF